MSLRRNASLTLTRQLELIPRTGSMFKLVEMGISGIVVLTGGKPDAAHENTSVE